MSVFRVKLRQGNQGKLDVDPSTGLPLSTSVQRTVYITGPNRANRKLNDGDTFTDSNYYKRFCYPAVSLEDAILEVVSDDGSYYSDVPGENNYPVVWDPGSVTAGTITAGTTYTTTGNYLDVVSTYGGPANFCQISSSDSGDSCSVKLNGSTDAIFTLGPGDVQVFDTGNLSVTHIAFENASSSNDVSTVQVILGIKSVSNS